MIAGPETELARGVPDFSTTTTGEVPVVPPEQPSAFTQGAPSPTNFTLPSYSKSEQLQVRPAQFSWAPGDEGFGQGQVQRYGFDTGMVPVAEMKLPFGALASRGDSIARREQQNQQAQKALKEKFDPYGGIGKAADPFQPAFGRYAMGTLNRLADDIIKAYSGDEEEAWRRIRTPGTQENQLWLQKSREISDIGTANQYEFKQYADLYADVLAGKQKVDPETREALRKFLSAQNELGIPVDGVDPAEFRSQRRDLEGMISAEAYMKNFMSQLPNMVQSVAQQLGKAMPVGGGRYALQDLAKKEFEPSLRLYAQEYSDTTGGRVSPEEAYEKFRKVFNDELERKTATWSPRADGAGSGDGGASKHSSVGYQHSPIQGASPDKNQPFDQAVLHQATGGRGQLPNGGQFYDPSNPDQLDVFMHPVSVFEGGDGRLYISGKVAKQPNTRAITKPNGEAAFEITTIGPDGSESTQEISEAQYFTQLKEKVIPLEGNEQSLAGLFPGRDLSEAELRRVIESGRQARLKKEGATGEPAAPGYKIGQVDDGYRYIGGDPTKPGRWKKVN